MIELADRSTQMCQHSACSQKCHMNVMKTLHWAALFTGSSQQQKNILSNAYEQGNECYHHNYSFLINLWVKISVKHSILNSGKLFAVIILQIAYSIDILMS